MFGNARSKVLAMFAFDISILINTFNIVYLDIADVLPRQKTVLAKMQF